MEIVLDRPIPRSWLVLAGLALALLATRGAAQDQPAPPTTAPPATAPAAELPSPESAKPTEDDLVKPKPIPDVPLGPVLKTTPVPRLAEGDQRDLVGRNFHLVDATQTPRDKAAQLDYKAQTANFKLGKTVKGGTSGATGVIVNDDDKGDAGTLILARVKGTFQDGEPLTDEADGAAVVDGSLREGIWILEFAFKPVRVITVEIPGKGRRPVHYLYYRVINNTGKPRMFVPHFILVTDPLNRRDKVHSYEDTVLPNAVEVIHAHEDSSTPLLGAVDVVGIFPPSGTKVGVDDAVFGVAIWEGVDPKADRFSVYVQGLSDGYQVVTPPDGGAPQVYYKTLRIDFDRPGDEFNINSREIHLADPPYEWVYWSVAEVGAGAAQKKQP